MGSSVRRCEKQGKGKYRNLGKRKGREVRGGKAVQKRKRGECGSVGKLRK